MVDIYLTLKDQKADLETEKIKATLMLCYGFITMYAPPSIVASRIDSTILRSIYPHMANAKVPSAILFNFIVQEFLRDFL